MNRGDRLLLVLPLLLTAVGIVMVYSSSAILGITRYSDPDYFFGKQVLRALVGVGIMLVFAKLRLRVIERAAPVLFGVAALALAAVIVIGQISHGAQRWLPLGPVTVQPTDGARLAAIAMLAWWLRRHPPEEHDFWRGVAAPLGLAGALAGLILLQPNLSSAGLLAATAFGMVMMAGARWRHLAIPVGVGAAAGTVMLLTHPYQMKRMATFAGYLFHGTLDARGAGWQLDQSLIALGSGGWLGRGIGGGLQKYLFLPEAHTDFIFSILGEETGFVGASLLLAGLGLYLWRGMRASARASEPFAALLAGGITIQIGLYALVNLMVATGLAPTTGLPLPFVSYGGSALLVNLAAAGVLYRVSATGEEREALARQRWAREAT